MSRRGRTRPRDFRCPEPDCDSPKGSSCARVGVLTEAGHHPARVELAARRAEEKLVGGRW